MARVSIGFMTWNTKRNEPHVGTRRRKVWTTPAQCEGHVDRFVSGELITVEVFAEVPEDGG